MTRAETDWPMVFLATAGGAAAAMHIGKAAAALPLMQAELDVTLAHASVYLSMISACAALTGLAIGRAAAAIGVMRAGIIGLTLMGLASLAGSFAETAAGVLFARIVEAIGLPLVVTTMPALVQNATTPNDRPLALGLWAAWLPIGVALSMALAFGILGDHGWRLFFAVCGGTSLALGGLLHLARHRVWVMSSAPPANRLPGIGHPLYRMALVFLLFSAANMIFMGFLPSVMIGAMHYDTGMATGLGFVCALLLLPTNIATGAAVGKGVRRLRLALISFAGIGLSGVAFLSSSLPDGMRIAAALTLATSTGIAPALVWSSVPPLAEDADIAPSIVAGVLYQAAGLGQMLGPVVAGTIVGATQDWEIAGLILLACSLAALAISWHSRKQPGFR
ncbi:MFS transporter [Cereibacter changlensis]|uniref:MFS transporter n=1 Tax=Cereibacter changlensis TaxID=402884 RepID=A0A4U0Z184_9RHOB|nr:MFS transporter [Cereibacter changlensis]TKA97069.1 MFS transporter [Cereibacter changlensis]